VGNFTQAKARTFAGRIARQGCGADLPDTESSSVMKGLQFLAKTISEHAPKKGIAI
jgi:hypothetical protein